MGAIYYKGQLMTVGNSPLAGKKICALGDSNTQYMGANLETTVKELTGCKSLSNLGYAGATWGETTDDKTSTGTNNCVSMVNKLCNPYIQQGYSNEFDIVTIMYGTNGDSGGVGTSSSTDITTTWGAMKYCFDKLLYYFRYGKIGVLLPPQRAGGIFEEPLTAIRECCELYSVPYYDICGQGQIPADSRMPYSVVEQGLPNQGYGQLYFADNLHFGNAGKEQYYHKYARFLESLI